MHNYLYHHIENQQRQGIEIPIRNYVGSPHVLLQHKVMSGFELRHVSLCLWEWIHRTKRTYWKFFKENAEPSSWSLGVPCHVIFVVHVMQTEPWSITHVPLEIIQKWPYKIAFDINIVLPDKTNHISLGKLI